MCKLVRGSFRLGGSVLSGVNESVVKRRPVVAITYVGCHSKYCFRSMAKEKDRNKHFDELEKFIEKFRQYDVIDDAISAFISHKKGKNTDAESIRLLKTIGAENGSIIHLHTKGGGNGEFVIHGTQIDNRFEILLLDPHHEYYQSH